MDEQTLWTAADAHAMADDLIGRHHPHLVEASILYWFTDKMPKSRGKILWAKTSKLSEAERFLHSGERDVDAGAEFKIVFTHEVWQDLSASQQRALVDHELCHIVQDLTKDEEPILVLRGHDVELFHEEIERHGLWTGELKHMGQVMAQLSLPLP